MKWAVIGLSEVFVNKLTVVLWCTSRVGIVASSQGNDNEHENKLETAKKKAR